MHLFQESDHLLLHLIVDGSITGERLATFLMAAQCTYHVRVFNLFINVSDKCAASHVRRCDLVYRFMHLRACPLVGYGYNAIQSGKPERFLDLAVIMLFRGKRKQTFAPFLTVFVNQRNSRFAQRNANGYRAILFRLSLDIFYRITDNMTY